MDPHHTIPSLRFIGEAEFATQVLQSTGDVLVAFWASWSDPCQVIEPVLLEVEETFSGKVTVFKVNADDSPCLSLRYAVQYIPTILYFQAGRFRGQLVGTVSKQAVFKLLCQDNDDACGNASPNQGGTI